MHTLNLEALQLDEPSSMQYSLKCCAAAVHAAATGIDYKRSLAEVVMEGGYAQVNGAVAGALLGCKLGYASIPQDWCQGLVHQEWLEAKVDKLCAALCI